MIRFFFTLLTLLFNGVLIAGTVPPETVPDVKTYTYQTSSFSSISAAASYAHSTSSPCAQIPGAYENCQLGSVYEYSAGVWRGDHTYSNTGANNNLSSIYQGQITFTTKLACPSSHPYPITNSGGTITACADNCNHHIGQSHFPIVQGIEPSYTCIGRCRYDLVDTMGANTAEYLGAGEQCHYDPNNPDGDGSNEPVFESGDDGGDDDGTENDGDGDNNEDGNDDATDEDGDGTDVDDIAKKTNKILREIENNTDDLEKLTNNANGQRKKVLENQAKNIDGLNAINQNLAKINAGIKDIRTVGGGNGLGEGEDEGEGDEDKCPDGSYLVGEDCYTFPISDAPTEYGDYDDALIQTETDAAELELNNKFQEITTHINQMINPVTFSGTYSENMVDIQGASVDLSPAKHLKNINFGWAVVLVAYLIAISIILSPKKS